MCRSRENYSYIGPHTVHIPSILFVCYEWLFHLPPLSTADRGAKWPDFNIQPNPQVKDLLHFDLANWQVDMQKRLIATF